MVWGPVFYDDGWHTISCRFPRHVLRLQEAIVSVVHGVRVPDDLPDAVASVVGDPSGLLLAFEVMDS